MIRSSVIKVPFVSVTANRAHLASAVARVHLQIEGFARPLSHQFEHPARSANAWDGQRLRRNCTHAPSRSCCCRVAEVGRFHMAAPAADHQPQRTALFRRKLKSSRHIHRQSNQLGDDRPKAAEPKRLLEGLGDFSLIVAIDNYKSIRMQAGLSKAGRVKVCSGQAPMMVPCVLAAIPAVDCADTAPCTASAPPPPTSWMASYARPPLGRRPSISCTSNASVLPARRAPASIFSMAFGNSLCVRANVHGACHQG